MRRYYSALRSSFPDRPVGNAACPLASPSISRTVSCIVVRPPIVYLDTSDWAYLHQGDAPKEERKLRALAESGKAQFLVTLHHFEETAAIQYPLDRGEFLRGFPGTVLTTVTGYDLLRSGVIRLIDENEATPDPTQRQRRLASVSQRELSALGTQWPSSPLRKLIVPLEDRRRAIAAQDRKALKRFRRKASRQDDLAIWRAEIRGDARKKIEVIERVTGQRVERNNRELIIDEVQRVSADWARGEAAGELPPRDLDFDRTFVEVVFVPLKPELKRDRSVIAATLKAWRTKCRDGSALSLAAAVYDSVDKNLERKYESSDQIDGLHATFAAFVDIFTADQRTVDALRPVRPKAKLMRSKRLAEVVAEIERASEVASSSATLPTS